MHDDLPPVDLPADLEALGPASFPGVPLGRLPDATALTSGDSLSPGIVYGTPRSGKTRGIAVPTVRGWPGPVLATSVRTDIVDLTLEDRRGLGRVGVLDPSGSLDHPDAVGWDPVSAAGTWDEAWRTATAHGHAGAAGERSAEWAFWSTMAVRAVAPMLLAANRQGKGIRQVLEWVALGREAATFASRSDAEPGKAALDAKAQWATERTAALTVIRRQVADDITAGRVERSEYRREWEERAEEWAADHPEPRSSAEGVGLAKALWGDDLAWACAAQVWRTHERTFSSIMACAAELLAPFATGGAVARAETGGADPDALVASTADTLYLVAPAAEQTAFAALFAAVVDRVVRAAHAREAAGQHGAPLLLMIDEAANVAPIRDLAGLATTAAGSRIQLVTVWHSHSQLVARHGRPQADAAAAAHPVVVALPGQRDPLTLQALEHAVDGEPVNGLHGEGRGRWRRVPEAHAVVVRGTEPAVLTDLRGPDLHGPNRALADAGTDEGGRQRVRALPVNLGRPGLGGCARSIPKCANRRGSGPLHSR